MPFYVYACQGCGATSERRQSFSDAPLTECDECGGALRRVLQPVGIIFKGSGFYTTDYGRGSRPRDDGETSKSGETGESDGVKSPERVGAPAASTGSDTKETSAASSAASGSTTSAS